MKIKIVRIRKHHILLSLGVAAAVSLPLGATMACGDSTEAPTTDQTKVNEPRNYLPQRLSNKR